MSTGKTVYFLAGHGEREIEGRLRERDARNGSGDSGLFAEGPDTFGRAADALGNETYRVESLLLATRENVPEDASAVVIAGPTRPMLPAEITALKRYVEAGGGLFVAIDPQSQTNLYDLLSVWGIELGDDVIVDRALAVFGQATTPIAGEYDGRHPITSRLREPTLFPQARSVLISDAAAEADYATLVKTGSESWAERDLDAWRETGRPQFGDGDLEGPVPVAIAGSPHVESAPGTPPSSMGRIVVFGDSDFVTNEFIDALRNRDLFVNSVNWLAGDIEQITVRPNVSRSSSFQMTQDEFRVIQTLSLFVLPEAIAILGVIVWWLRRKAPGR